MLEEDNYNKSNQKLKDNTDHNPWPHQAMHIYESEN